MQGRNLGILPPPLKGGSPSGFPIFALFPFKKKSVCFLFKKGYPKLRGLTFCHTSDGAAPIGKKHHVRVHIAGKRVSEADSTFLVSSHGCI